MKLDSARTGWMHASCHCFHYSIRCQPAHYCGTLNPTLELRCVPKAPDLKGSSELSSLDVSSGCFPSRHRTTKRRRRRNIREQDGPPLARPQLRGAGHPQAPQYVRTVYSRSFWCRAPFGRYGICRPGRLAGPALTFYDLMEKDRRCIQKVIEARRCLDRSRGDGQRSSFRGAVDPTVRPFQVVSC